MNKTRNFWEISCRLTGITEEKETNYEICDAEERSTINMSNINAAVHTSELQNNSIREGLRQIHVSAGIIPAVFRDMVNGFSASQTANL